MILTLHHRFKVTTIMVTHEISEVFRMANRVMIIENGVIRANGTPQQVFAPKLSAKLTLTGTVIANDKYETVTILTICIGNSITQVLASPEEGDALVPGDQVIVAAKAFSPLVIKSEISHGLKSK
jgi:molybdate transport system ATP-binding protein